MSGRRTPRGAPRRDRQRRLAEKPGYAPPYTPLLTKAEIAKAFGCSRNYVEEVLATIPGLVVVGSGRKCLHRIPLVSMPPTYLRENGIARIRSDWLEFAPGIGRDRAAG